MLELCLLLIFICLVAIAFLFVILLFVQRYHEKCITSCAVFMTVTEMHRDVVKGVRSII